MAQKKAHEVEGWLRRPPEHVSIVLIYGPDRGLVSERARTFAEKTGLPLDDPFSVVLLEAGEAERDQGRLLDEARTVPMFSARRLLWVRNAGAQKSLAEDVKLLSAEPPRDAIILIEAGDLKKGVGLRSAVEASAIGMALPCYGDEDRDIDSVIDDELGKSGMSIAMEARSALRRNLGGDRLATRGEIAKLALYAHGKREIELEDVLALTGDVSGVSVDDAVDAMLDGKIDDFDQTFTRQSLSGSQAYHGAGGGYPSDAGSSPDARRHGRTERGLGRGRGETAGVFRTAQARRTCFGALVDRCAASWVGTAASGGVGDPAAAGPCRRDRKAGFAGHSGRGRASELAAEIVSRLKYC